MTTYYYLASDQKLEAGQASLDFAETEGEMTPGFDYPVQREIMNGVAKEWECRELMQYVRNHMARYDVCTVQIAHVVNPVRLNVQHHSTIALHDLLDPSQLLLEVGQLITIHKDVHDAQR